MVERGSHSKGDHTVNGKLAPALAESLAQYEAREQKRRDEDERLAHVAAIEAGEEWIKPEAKKDEQWYVPGELDHHEFLIEMGWTSADMYLSQPLWWYERQWAIYEFKLKTGLTQKGSLF